MRGDIGQPSRRFMRSSQGDSEGDARRSARGSSSSARSRSRRSRGRSGGDGGSSGGGGGGRGGGGGDDDDDDEDDEADDDAVIWGTTVRVGDATRAFRAFVRGFGAGVPSAADPHAQLAKYQRVLLELADAQETHVNVDCQEVANFSRACARLYEQLLKYPQEIIPLMDMVMGEELSALLATNPTSDRDPEGGEAPRVQVRVFNLRSANSIRLLEPRHIDSLVAISGMVIRASAVIPDMRVAFFACTTPGCGHTVRVENDRGRIDVPPICPSCNAKASLAIVHNRSVFNDKQLIKLQETPESVPDGETPHTITLYAHEDLVDAVVPGDRVRITGIFRALPSRLNPRMRNLRSVFRSFVDVVHV